MKPMGSLMVVMTLMTSVASANSQSEADGQDVSPTSPDVLMCEARAQTKLLDVHQKLFLLRRDHRYLTAWYEDHLEVLRERLETLHRAEPSNLQYRVLLGSVATTLDYAPPSYLEGEETVDPRSELAAALAEARRVVARLQAAGIEVDATLTTALTNAL